MNGCPRTTFVGGVNPFHPYVPTGHVLGSRSYQYKSKVNSGRPAAGSLSQDVRNWVGRNPDVTPIEVGKAFDISAEHARSLLQKQHARGLMSVTHRFVGRKRFSYYEMKGTPCLTS